MKNTEIELKYRLEDLAQFMPRLKKLGMKKIKSYSGCDTYYLVPDNPGGRKYLRVREQEGRMELDYHYAQSDTHTDEWETVVGSAEITKEILGQLGYKIDVTIEKQRQIYQYKDSEVVVDEVKDLGSFVEIESPNEEELRLIIKELGLDEEHLVKGMGYSDLKRGYMLK